MKLTLWDQVPGIDFSGRISRYPGHERKDSHTCPRRIQKLRSFFESLAAMRTNPAETCASIMLCLAHQASFLLGRQLKRLEQDFLEKGGLTEGMYHPRSRSRQGGFREPAAPWKVQPGRSDRPDSSNQSQQSDLSDTSPFQLSHAAKVEYFTHNRSQAERPVVRGGKIQGKLRRRKDSSASESISADGIQYRMWEPHRNPCDTSPCTSGDKHPRNKRYPPACGFRP